VIFITTKSGSGLKAGQGEISFSTSYTVDKVSRLPDLQDKYSQGSYGAFGTGTSNSWGPAISTLGRYENIWGDSVDAQVYDNVDPFFQTGQTYTIDLGLTRGGEIGNYAASIGYLNQEGVIPTTGMIRYTGRINAEMNITKKIKTGASAMYTRTEVDKIASGSNTSNPLFTTYYAPRNFDLWGNPYAYEDNPYIQYNYRAAMDNPRWSLANNKFNEINDRFIGAMDISYSPWAVLTIKYKLGVDYFTNSQKEVYELGSGNTGGRPADPEGGDLPTGGSIRDFTYSQRTVNSNLMAIFTKDFGPISTNLIIGNEIYNDYSEELQVLGSDFNFGGYHNMANTNSQIPYQAIDERRTVGFYGSLSLSYKTILTLNATGRNDYVSYLAEGNRSYFYPSIGASFVFTDLLEINKSILSFGKLRASWAQVGQEIPYSYGTQNVFVQGGAGSGFLQDGFSVPTGTGINAFTQGDTYLSTDLKPALSSTTEFGIELSFINNRIGLNYTYFNTVNKDQIFRVPVPASTGYAAELKNAGTLLTNGHEVTLNLIPVKLSDFEWRIDVNFTKFTSKVDKLAEGVETIYLGGFETPSIRAIAGETYPSIYGIGYLRDDEGNIIVLDDPGSPTNGMPLIDEQAKKIGDVQPDFIMGFVNTFTYKGITLTAFVDWKQGGEMFSGNNMLGCMYGMLEVTEDRETPVVLDAVKGYYDDNGELVITGENDIAILRDQNYWRDVMSNMDEPHVYNSSYVRFRELSLGYDLPSKLLSKTFIKALNISFVARNLALWTEYPNFDPEVSTNGATNAQGLEYVAFPQTTSYGGKLSFKF
jgi:TonB-linked SusC/RagA family outer membrane protein